jgi:metal-responsive CopG/Arc/MetJ family transcriptional regulator
MSATKVTLTLPEDLLAVVDGYVDEHEGVTRSGVCADALREWLRARQEAEIAAYYLGESDKERAENADWNTVSAASAVRRWE